MVFRGLAQNTTQMEPRKHLGCLLLFAEQSSSFVTALLSSAFLCRLRCHPLRRTERQQNIANYLLRRRAGCIRSDYVPGSVYRLNAEWLASQEIRLASLTAPPSGRDNFTLIFSARAYTRCPRIMDNNHKDI